MYFLEPYCNVIIKLEAETPLQFASLRAPISHVDSC